MQGLQGARPSLGGVRKRCPPIQHFYTENGNLAFRQVFAEGQVCPEEEQPGHRMESRKGLGSLARPEGGRTWSLRVRKRCDLGSSGRCRPRGWAL